MFLTVISLTLFLRISYGLGWGGHYETCVPNTQFMMNGRVCYCSATGRWSDESCHYIARRQTCKPGQIIWEECSQCICQEAGRVLCTNTQCPDVITKNSSDIITNVEQWCTPFRSYYINCSLCVCPASGKMAEARCAADSSCKLKGPLPLSTIMKHVCIPKVMYRFPCLHCLCTDLGSFAISKCVETCSHYKEPDLKCVPRTFYRVNCNVCRCPDNGVPDTNLCTKSACAGNPRFESLDSLKNRTSRCVTNKFARPQCYYCECSSQGAVNTRACLELECLTLKDFTYDFVRGTCNPNEMVPICTECFCTPSGFTVAKFCTKVCSFRNKMQMIETMLIQKLNVIDHNNLKHASSHDICDPNSVFLDQGRYCLCPDNGNANFKLCTSIVENPVTTITEKIINVISTAIDFNATCEPNTYIEFDCNSCYCSKNGKIDPKWCTYDDCEAKRVIQNNHKSLMSSVPSETSGACLSGTIYKVDCNYCICGESGNVKDRACTKNVCTGDYKVSQNEFACEPSVYYTVDCNICFCPADGLKNLDKCTNNQCESNFLRTESCVPGELFSDDCNICVCPPNGDKKSKVCTKRTCADSDTPWKKIFQLSQNLRGNRIPEDTTRNLEQCFPGEEFVVGCKVCVCPEMGLREYATCTTMLCDENRSMSNHSRTTSRIIKPYVRITSNTK